MSPFDLFDTLVEHFNQMRDDLISVLIIRQTDEHELVIDFLKSKWCNDFITQLEEPDLSVDNPQYYKRNPDNAHSMCFQGVTGPDEKIVIEFPTQVMGNRFRRLLRDIPEQKIASMPGKKVAVSLSGDRFFTIPLPGEIYPSSTAVKADNKRALRLLLLGSMDNTSLFTHFPKELICFVACLISPITKSQPFAFPFQVEPDRSFISTV
jgi:hypothetical protein